MRIPGAAKVGRCVHRLRRWRRSRGVVLMYHRVAEAARDPYGMAVRPVHFEQHLEVLRRLGGLVPLAEFRRRMTTTRERWVAVTFDDGYADALHEALPLLQRHEVPATVFVATGGLDGGAFWWDVLEERVLGPHPLPGRIELGDDVLEVPAEARPAPPPTGGTWSALHEPPPTPRHALFLELQARLERVPSRRVAVLAALGDAMPAARALTLEELAALAACPWIEIGAHSVSHGRLTALPAAERRREIESGREVLAAVTGQPVSRFSYPHGAHDDATVADVRAAGFVEAYCSRQRITLAHSDPFRMPRVVVPDCDGDAFEDFLCRWWRA